MYLHIGRVHSVLVRDDTCKREGIREVARTRVKKQCGGKKAVMRVSTGTRGLSERSKSCWCAEVVARQVSARHFGMMPWTHQQPSCERELFWRTTGMPTSQMGRRCRGRCMAVERGYGVGRYYSRRWRRTRRRGDYRGGRSMSGIRGLFKGWFIKL